jgi:hypothetical protein
MKANRVLLDPHTTADSEKQRHPNSAKSKPARPPSSQVPKRSAELHRVSCVCVERSCHSVACERCLKMVLKWSLSAVACFVRLVRPLCVRVQ